MNADEIVIHHVQRNHVRVVLNLLAECVTDKLWEIPDLVRMLEDWEVALPH